MSENGIKSVGSMTLNQILQRKAKFSKNNTIYDAEEMKYYVNGEQAAFSEMLVDMSNGMNEVDFESKYKHIVSVIKITFALREEDKVVLEDSEVEYKSGYNNAIVEILSLINPINQYDIEDHKELK